MITNIRDIASWYPIIPIVRTSDTQVMEAIPSIVSKIVDANIILHLPAVDRDDTDKPYNINAFKVSITSIAENIAIAHCECSLLSDGYLNINVPVYTSRDAQPSIGTNYIIMTEPENFSETSDTFLEIHPDCITCWQDAPTLTFYNRGEVSSIDGTKDAEGNIVDGQINESQDPYELTTLAFSDGYNVSARHINDTIVFTAGSKYGLGVYTEPPYPEDENIVYTVKSGKGLRSINGITNAVIINSDTNILTTDIDMHEDDTSKLNITLKAK